MYKRPKRPYDKERITKEKKILKEFGLRRKKEVWRAESLLRNFRRRAQSLLARSDDQKQKELFDRLNKLGLKVEKLDDVLILDLEHILARRLQTIVYKKGLAKTIKEARQLIVHRHVIVDDRKIWYPSYLVTAEKEANISLDEGMRSQKIADLQANQ